MKTSESTTVKSASRVLDIMELLAGQEDSLNLSEIARNLNMPASSTHSILNNLLERGYLETDRNGKKFRLGYKVFEIGARYMRNSSLTKEFYSFADQVVGDINETVFLVIRESGNILYIAEKQNTNQLRFVSHLGMKLPLHATASGKVLLSGLSEEMINEIYPENDLGKFTEKTLTTRNGLMEEIKEISEGKIAFSYGEAVDGIHCVATPIINAKGEIVASISVSIPTIRINDDVWNKTMEWMKEGSRVLSSKVYFQ